MLALSFAVALAVLETGAFFTTALATGFTTFAGAVTFFGVAAAFGAVFFAVAIFKFPFLFNWLKYFTSTVLSPIFSFVTASSFKRQEISQQIAVIKQLTSRSLPARRPSRWLTRPVAVIRGDGPQGRSSHAYRGIWVK